MKIVYISGPLTTGWDGKDREYIQRNVQKAEAFHIALANKGIGAFCAHTHTSSHGTSGSLAPESYYYNLDMEILKRASDGVLAMPGWETSYGAKLEVEWVLSHGLPVFYPKSIEDISDIVSWVNKVSLFT